MFFGNDGFNVNGRMQPRCCSYEKFQTTALTILALGEAVPCRPGGTTAEAYKRSKGTNDVAYAFLALQKIDSF
ncbi:hypothetical protein [Pedobacter suwonensis]|uniref:hypothetical protein n=1 Tax=Pedobacter suwonensis TaxID=332999 RepID=UPI003D0792E2